MGFLFLIILIISVFFIVRKIKSSDEKNAHSKYGRHHFSQEGYYIDDDYDYLNDNYNDIDNYKESHSSFAYPDPYDLPPEKAMYVDDDGELLDDL